MSVESGPSGAVVVGIGSSLNARFGPSISGPESISRLSSSIVNEGPAGRLGLEKTMPIIQLGFKPAGEIQFNSPAEKGQAALEPLATVEPMMVPKVGQPEWVYSPWITPVPEPATQLTTVLTSKIENRVASQPAQSIYTPVTQQEQEIEEVIEEKVLTKNQNVKPEVEENEDSSVLKVKFVEAVEISEARKKEISSAVRRLKGKGIIGRWLKELLSVGFWKSKSPIVGEGRDHTIDLTVSEIVSDTAEYKTPEEAEKIWMKTVEENIPVKEGEGGRTATVEEIRKVTHGEDQKAPQSNTPAEIVVRRVVKKKIEKSQTGSRVLEDKVEVNRETNLAELSPALAEVFQKAT